MAETQSVGSRYSSATGEQQRAYDKAHGGAPEGARLTLGNQVDRNVTTGTPNASQEAMIAHTQAGVARSEGTTGTGT